MYYSTINLSLFINYKYAVFYIQNLFIYTYIGIKLYIL
jgi:hypothetical protein